MSLSFVRRLARSSVLLPRHVHPPAFRLNNFGRLPVSRTYASKKKPQSTANFVPGSQQLFDSEHIRAEYAKAEAGMTTALEWYRKEMAELEVRAGGRFSPALLDPIRVTLPSRNGGGTVKLNEVATVGIKDGYVLIVTVFDEHNMKAVEQGIYAAKLPHIIPQRLDARTLKIPIPKPTVESRNSLLSAVGHMAERIRVQIRDRQQSGIKGAGLKKHAVELEAFEKLSDKYIGEVDKILAHMMKVTAPK